MILRADWSLAMVSALGPGEGGLGGLWTLGQHQALALALAQHEALALASRDYTRMEGEVGARLGQPGWRLLTDHQFTRLHLGLGASRYS